jgi:hypothetical protein
MKKAKEITCTKNREMVKLPSDDFHHDSILV